MLVLNTNNIEVIRIGENIHIAILRKGKQIRLGVDAPKDLKIDCVTYEEMDFQTGSTLAGDLDE